MRTRGHQTSGMTLVELMIVVVIIALLAALATVGYRKYIARSRLSEANAMLAEFAAKEQLYFLDNGQFMEAHYGASNYPSVNETASEFWPHDPGVDWDSARDAFPVRDSSGNIPPSWRQLGLRPRWNQLFCTYMVNAGAPGIAPPGTVGPTLWGAAPNVPWFYAMAVCNLVRRAGWPNDPGSGNFYVTSLVLTHDSPAIRTTDENQ